MSYRAWLPARALPGRRDELVLAFIARQILEECMRTIPGFLHGELMLSEDDPDGVCVSVEWVDRQSFLDWQNSPVRAAQGPDFVHLLQVIPSSQLYRSVHVVAAH